MKKIPTHLEMFFPIYALFALLMVLGICKCQSQEVEPTVREIRIVDTIRDTVYKSFRNGKLFGVEVNTYVIKRNSLKENTTRKEDSI
jgi:hypothetical protein